MVTHFNTIEVAFERKDQFTLDEFNRLLENFDWYYCFSDDFSVWEQCDREHDFLKEIAQHRGGAFEKLMKAWRKHRFSGEPWSIERERAPRPPSENIEIWIMQMHGN